MTTTTLEPRTQTSARSVEAVHASTGFHWVGDGFFVSTYFPSRKLASERVSPFVLMDYGPPKEFAQLERGKRLTEILKQGQYQPMPVEKQVLIIWTVTNGLADDIAVEDLKAFEADLTDFIQKSHPAVFTTLRDKKSIDDDLKASMKEAVEDFKATRWGKSGDGEVAAATA